MTKLKIQISKKVNVKITVFEINGREVAILVSKTLNSGSYEFIWDASVYPSGVYFYKMEAGDFISSRKMLLIK